MRKNIYITGTSYDELKSSLELVYSMFLKCHCDDCKGITAFRLFQHNPLADSNSSRESIDDGPELHLYSSLVRQKDAENFPCAISMNPVCDMIWEWLSKQEINHDIDTDGSLGRGWNLSAADPIFGFSDNPLIIVRFTTMVYGK